MKQLILIFFCLIFFYACREDPGRKDHFVTREQTSVAPSNEKKGSPIVTNLPIQRKKKKNYTQAEFKEVAPAISISGTDTGRIARIESLRASGILPDMNEPLTRREINAYVNGAGFESMIELARDKLLKVQGENDLLDNTDRFYTNGIRIDLVAPFLEASPLSRILVPYWHAGKNYYGICLVQNMYTPSTTKVGGILYGDRPYAAYLYVGSYKITNDSRRLIRVQSELAIGVLGQASLGEYVQKTFHNSVPTNSEPLGWQYQICNDLLLNYAVGIEKGILSRPAVEINVNGNATLGTVLTNIGGGIYLRAGRINPWFGDLGVHKRQVNLRCGLKNTQFYFFMRSGVRFIGYDATLEGGVLNKTSPYTISSQEMSRVQLKTSAGLAFVQGGFRLELEQFLLSPEFSHGWWHKWVSLGLTFAL
jgi:lipid A 3-O-deacylase